MCRTDAETEAETAGEVPEYDPADFPGFTREQVIAGFVTPACGEVK